MIKKLPHWVLTDVHPSFYDMESVTAIEMVAKLYGKMEEMISDYNTFVDNVNNEIKRFETGINKDFNDFKTCIQTLMNNYIQSIDMKINIQDEKIEEAINYMKDNIYQVADDLINQAIQSGTLYVGFNYDSVEEEITIVVTEEEEGV